MRIAFAIIAIGVAGCSALTSLDDLSQTGDAANVDANGSDVAQGNDASTNDVVQTNDASDAGGGGNLVTNGDFETGQGGCGTGWGNGYSMTFSRVTPGHTGSACLVCTNLLNLGSYELDSTLKIPVQAGNYYAEGWMMTPWDGGAAVPSPGVGLQVKFAGDGGLSGCVGDNTICQANFVTAGNGWMLSSTTFVVSGSGTLQVVAHAYNGSGGSCFALDDVALYAQ